MVVGFVRAILDKRPKPKRKTNPSYFLGKYLPRQRGARLDLRPSSKSREACLAPLDASGLTGYITHKSQEI